MTTSSSTEDWDEEKCIKLIREYRSRTILWNPNNPYFFKKDLKQPAWEEVAQAMELPVEVCRRKMLVLMASFRREKCKILKCIENRDGSHKKIYKSTWFAFKEMAFLMDKAIERDQRLRSKRGSEEYDDYPSDTPNIKRALLEHHVQTPIGKDKTNMEYPASVKEKLENVYNYDETRPRESPERSVRRLGAKFTSSAWDRDEEVNAFTSFIASKMKRYTETTKNAVEQAICEIIFKADQNLYDNLYYNSDHDTANTLDADEDDNVVIKPDPESVVEIP